MINIESQLRSFIAESKKINVFIIGLRGYTRNYGGWETFVQGLIRNWVNGEVQWWAYEKVDSIAQQGIVTVNGVICIRVCELEPGSSAMMKYDKHCTDLIIELRRRLKGTQSAGHACKLLF